jgi:hypothetical protein
MSRKPQFLLVAFVALSVAFAAGPALAAQPDIAGKYQCAGSNPDGSRYSGTVVITPMGSAWRIDWTIAGSSHGGVGLLEGNVFSACWNIRGTRDGGIVVYRTEPDGRMIGQWSTTKGSGSVATETLTRVRVNQAR